jgi:cyclase
MAMRRRGVLVAALLGIGLSVPVGGAVQTPGGGAVVEVVPVRPNFFLLAGAGGNIAAQVGEDGIVLVDTGSERTADAVLAALKTLTDKPIRYIINTAADADHVGANAQASRAGQSLAAGGAGQPGGIGLAGPAPIVASERVFLRMSVATGQQTPYPTAAWPTETFTRKHKVLYLNSEGIEVIAVPAAHSDGDSLVFFRRSDVIAAGDVFDVTRFPVLDVNNGGSIQGEIEALNRVIDLAIPSIPLPTKDGGTLIVAGHGRICQQFDVVEYRDMVTIVRDRVQDLMKNRMTLEQIQAANPTQGWTARYGAGSAQAFVEAIYKGLTPKPLAKPAAPARGTAPRR